MDTEYIILEEISVMDLTIVGCPVAHLGMIAHRSNAAINLEKSIPDDAVIVSQKKNQVKFQYNLEHGIIKMITWTFLSVND